MLVIVAISVDLKVQKSSITKRYNSVQHKYESYVNGRERFHKIPTEKIIIFLIGEYRTGGIKTGILLFDS